MVSKDEALKMAIEFMETLTIDVGIKTWNEKHRKEAIQACKEALEQHSGDVVVTKNEQGQIVCVTRQDAEGNILSVIAESEQPAQEPVAWISESTLKHSAEYRNRFDDAKSWAEIRAVDRKTTNCDVPLYTHPAPSWQGLSLPDIEEVLMNYEGWGRIDFARAIEFNLKEKNYGI